MGSLKLIKCNPDAPRDPNHRVRMLQEMCPHPRILVDNVKGIHCETCAILFTISFEQESGELTFWPGKPMEEKPDDLHDPA